MPRRIFCLAICFTLGLFGDVANAQELDSDYKIQGEYSGTLNVDGGELKYGIQVIALGKHKFTGVGYMGGLPGDGWNLEAPQRVEDVELKDGAVEFRGTDAVALIKDGAATIQDFNGATIGELKRIERKSPTLGAKPPKGAKVLFDGSSVDGWTFKKNKPPRMTDDGLLMQGANSKERFQSHHLHLEFRTPYKPEARNQARGNSGLYLQGRYEVQVLDSFGLTGEYNECGGIYEIKKPDQNMCFPPMTWQTYDVEFHAAEYKDGEKVKNAWMTVKHNGVTIHERVELPRKTRAAPLNEGEEPGFVHLQDHGNPVRFRNVWVKEIGVESDDSKLSKESFQLDNEIKVDYLLSLPPNYEAKEKHPLLLFLHGAGERGNKIDLVGKHGPPKKVKAGESMPFIVVSPQCKKGKRWDPAQLSKLLDSVESKYKVDNSRVYVTGLSMGGYGTWSLAAHSPDRFAAAIPICGGASAEVAKKIGDKVPLWVFHGSADSVVPLERSQIPVDALKAEGVEVKFTIYPDVNHDSWTATYDNPQVYEWLLSHSK